MPSATTHRPEFGEGADAVLVLLAHAAAIAQRGEIMVK
jgi:hypothetical protein